VLDVTGGIVIPGMISAYSRIRISAAGKLRVLQVFGSENRAIDNLRWIPPTGPRLSAREIDRHPGLARRDRRAVGHA
jgi:hypothetical protein